MIRRYFRCTACGFEFDIDVFEKGEAEEKGKASYPVQCKKCLSRSVTPLH